MLEFTWNRYRDEPGKLAKGLHPSLLLVFEHETALDSFTMRHWPIWLRYVRHWRTDYAGRNNAIEFPLDFWKHIRWPFQRDFRRFGGRVRADRRGRIWFVFPDAVEAASWRSTLPGWLPVTKAQQRYVGAREAAYRLIIP